MKMVKRLIYYTMCLGFGSFILCGSAQSFEVPQAALDACASKAMGDPCSFVTKKRNENLEGTCLKRPRGDGKLICAPKPPQQAFDACKSKNEGDACTFTGRRNNTVNGVCHKRPRFEGKMVCARMRPDRGNMQGSEK